MFVCFVASMSHNVYSVKTGRQERDGKREWNAQNHEIIEKMKKNNNTLFGIKLIELLHLDSGISVRTTKWQNRQITSFTAAAVRGPFPCECQFGWHFLGIPTGRVWPFELCLRFSVFACLASPSAPSFGWWRWLRSSAVNQLFAIISFARHSNGRIQSSSPVMQKAKSSLSIELDDESTSLQVNYDVNQLLFHLSLDKTVHPSRNRQANERMNGPDSNYCHKSWLNFNSNNNVTAWVPYVIHHQ